MQGLINYPRQTHKNVFEPCAVKYNTVKKKKTKKKLRGRQISVQRRVIVVASVFKLVGPEGNK